MNEQVKAIRAYVERLRDEHEKAVHACSGLNNIAMAHGGAQKVCNEILNFIDSQPDEQPNKDLETEIATWIPAHINGIDGDEWKDRNQTVYITLSAIIGWSGCIARHFAKWGAEHQVIDGNKMIEPSKSLEEAAITFATDTLPFGEGTYVDGGEYRGFIAGAQWQAKQMPAPEDTVLFQRGVEEGKRLMMEDAIGVEVVGKMRDLRIIDSTQRCLFDAKQGDWLRIIIVKEN